MTRLEAVRPFREDLSLGRIESFCAPLTDDLCPAWTLGRIEGNGPQGGAGVRAPSMGFEGVESDRRASTMGGFGLLQIAPVSSACSSSRTISEISHGVLETPASIAGVTRRVR